MHATPRWTRWITFTLLAALALPAAYSGASAAPMLTPDKDPLVQDLDPTVKPGTDFFNYSCGGWIKKNPIPPSERGWGIANLVMDETYGQLRGICEAAAVSGAAHGTVDQKVGDFWATGMDSAAVEAAGAAPMQPYFDQIAAIRSRGDLLNTIAKLRVDGIGTLYSMFVAQDERNSEKYVIHLYQGGLGLPNRDYYFKSDSNTVRVRGEYHKHLTAMFRLLGENAVAAKRSGDVVYNIERRLARRSRTLEQLRDPWANYNKLPLAKANKLTPSIDWAKQIAAMGVRPQDTLIVGQPEFFAQADSCINEISLADWKTYLRWNVVGEMAPRLSHAFDWQNFHFYSTVLSGTKEQRPRWKRVLDSEENSLGELMGMAWVRQYCSPATKARYEKLTEDIISVYRERIAVLPWMSEATRKAAIDKLDHVTRKVGYPDKWRDYSAMDFDRSSWAAAQMRINAWWFHHEADKLGKPIDRSEWDMNPQTYNAYYNGSNVEIVLPAAAFAIPGVADSLVDDALLYSYAGGSTIGHEITHGFDDEGRQSDAHGNLNPWWTEQDSIQFAQRADRLVNQFNDYMVGDLHVRGRACLGENIADLGGVRLGYEAFKKTAQYKSGAMVNGFTPDQRYFLGYALSWLGQRRPQALAQQIMTDVHAPGFLRVNGPLANIPEFYAAFGIKPGEPMYRSEDKRCVIW